MDNQLELLQEKVTNVNLRLEVLQLRDAVNSLLRENFSRDGVALMKQIEALKKAKDEAGAVAAQEE